MSAPSLHPFAQAARVQPCTGKSTASGMVLDFSDAPTEPHLLGPFLVDTGFFVDLLTYGEKAPPAVGWQQNATNDPLELMRRLRNADGSPRRCNYLALAWRFRDWFTAVVDVDVRGEKRGLEALHGLMREGLISKPLATFRTGSGGWHFWYRVPQPLRSGVNVLGPGIDVKSAGGYVVMPGSVVNGGTYRIEEFPWKG